jgi:hypothetical protein
MSAIPVGFSEVLSVALTVSLAWGIKKSICIV